MKKIVLFVFAASVLASCNQDIKEDNSRLKEENQELREAQAYQDSTIDEFAEAFESVQTNLAQIREREEEIRAARVEGMENTPETKEQILEDIEAINQLLEENKQTIKELNNKIASQGEKVTSLNRLVTRLRQQIVEKDEQIGVLKEDLASANFKLEQLNSKVGSLTEEKMAQKKQIEEQISKLNTAYYAVGDADALEENKVIDEQGGFIGIGRTKTLADNFNKDYFTRIDTSKTDEIPLDLEEDDAQLVTTHPENSYEWVKENEQIVALKIKNRQEFWKSSNYLVILVD